MNNQSTSTEKRKALVFVAVMAGSFCLLPCIASLFTSVIKSTLMNIGASTWKLVFEVCAVVFVGILNYLLGSFFSIKNPSYNAGFTASDYLLRRWLSAVSVIAVVLLVATDQQNGLAFVAIYPNSRNNNTTTFWGGITATYVVLVIFALIYRLISRSKGKGTPKSSLDMSNPLIAEDIKYYDWRERLAYLTVLPFMVVAEDLVFRGFLIWHLGNQIGTFIPWIVISVVLSVVMHLYQGRKLTTVITHFIYASSFVVLLIVFHNLLAVISAHLFIDILFTLLIWRQVREANGLTTITKFDLWKTIPYSIFIITNITVLYIAVVWLFS